MAVEKLLNAPPILRRAEGGAAVACPLDGGCNVTSTPAFFKAAASSSLWLNGTAGSRSPCMMRKGAALLDT